MNLLQENGEGATIRTTGNNPADWSKILPGSGGGARAREFPGKQGMVDE